MTQEERRQKLYEEVVGFIETNKRNLSKYVGLERDLLQGWGLTAPPVALTLRYARTIKGPAYFFYRLARNNN